jgi:hypothetical protein
MKKMSAHEHNTDMGIDISDIALDLDRDWSISYLSVVEIRIHHHVGCKVGSALPVLFVQICQFMQ